MRVHHINFVHSDVRGGWEFLNRMRLLDAVRRAHLSCTHFLHVEFFQNSPHSLSLFFFFLKFETRNCKAAVIEPDLGSCLISFLTENLFFSSKL